MDHIPDVKYFEVDTRTGWMNTVVFVTFDTSHLPRTRNKLFRTSIRTIVNTISPRVGSEYSTYTRTGPPLTILAWQRRLRLLESTHRKRVNHLPLRRLVVTNVRQIHLSRLISILWKRCQQRGRSVELAMEDHHLTLSRSRRCQHKRRCCFLHCQPTR